MSGEKNEIRTEPRPNCFVCGSQGDLLYRDVPSALYDTPGRWSFSRCPNPKCGLVWINPTPIEADLHKGYESYFTHAESNQGNPRRGLRDALYALYGAANLPGWWLTGIAQEKKRRALMFLDRIKPGTLLDVGCGDGKFLSEMKARGWAVDGIDFDSEGIRAAKEKYGLSLRHGDLRQANLAAESFDAVTMSHVIEHLADPVGMLLEIRRLLKSGGRLVITTPNIESIGHKKFGMCWFGLDAPRHLNLFTANALIEVTNRAGFGKAEASSTSASADVFIGASFTLREKHGHRMGHNPPPNILRTLKAAWWQYREHFALKREPKCGEELVIVAT